MFRALEENQGPMQKLKFTLDHGLLFSKGTRVVNLLLKVCMKSL